MAPRRAPGRPPRHSARHSAASRPRSRSTASATATASPGRHQHRRPQPRRRLAQPADVADDERPARPARPRRRCPERLVPAGRHQHDVRGRRRGQTSGTEAEELDQVRPAAPRSGAARPRTTRGPGTAAPRSQARRTPSSARSAVGVDGDVGALARDTRPTKTSRSGSVELRTGLDGRWRRRGRCGRRRRRRGPAVLGPRGREPAVDDHPVGQQRGRQQPAHEPRDGALGLVHVAHGAQARQAGQQQPQRQRDGGDVDPVPAAPPAAAGRPAGTSAPRRASARNPGGVNASSAAPEPGGRRPGRPGGGPRPRAGRPRAGSRRRPRPARGQRRDGLEGHPVGAVEIGRRGAPPAPCVRMAGCLTRSLERPSCRPGFTGHAIPKRSFRPGVVPLRRHGRR